MSKQRGGASGSRPRKRPRPYSVHVDLGEVLAGQVDEIAAEVGRRDRRPMSRSEAIRACVAYAWRHASTLRFTGFP